MRGRGAQDLSQTVSNGLLPPIQMEDLLVNAKADGQAKSRLMRTIPALAAVGGVLALVGCGSSSSTTSSSQTSPATPAATPTSSTPAAAAGSSAGGQTVDLAANPEGQLKYDKSAITVKAGKVNIVFTNMAPLEHNLNVESSARNNEGGTPTFKGGTRTLSVTLKAGKYKFFCSVPGHRAAGMEGTITVQ